LQLEPRVQNICVSTHQQQWHFSISGETSFGFPQFQHHLAARSQHLLTPQTSVVLTAPKNETKTEKN